MTERDEKFMRRAMALAQNGIDALSGGPFGAVVVKGGEIVGEGCNRVTSTNDPTAHAEVVAIRNAAVALETFDLTGCEIYSSCEPCPMCLAAIYWSHCSAIFYGNTSSDAADAGFDDAFLYEEVRRSVEQRMIPAVNLMREQAISNFEAWREYAGRIDY